MASTSSLGIGSGLDLSSLLDNIASAERQRLVPMQRRASSFETKLTAFGALQGALDNVQSAADKLASDGLFGKVKLKTAGDAFTASADGTAGTGNYSIEVNQLARAQSLVSAGQASTDQPIGNGGTITLSLGNGAGDISETVDIEIGADNSTLAGIRNAINDADIGVGASIINDGSGTPHRLVLSSNATGTDSQISVSVNESGDGTATPLGDLLNYDSATGSGNLSETVTAGNALLSVNGIAISSQSNTVEQAIEGVTLNLASTTEAPQSLTASRDDESVKGALKSFVDAFNQMQDVSGRLTAYNGADRSSGILMGDSTVRTVENRVRSALNTPVEDGTFSSLAQIGISLGRDGKMSIDDDALDNALSSDRDGVARLVAGRGETAGVAGRLRDAIESLAGEDNSLLSRAKDGLQTRIDGVADTIARERESIEATVERFRAQFVELDSLMASINSTSNYLTQQFASLSGGSSQ